MPRKIVRWIVVGLICLVFGALFITRSSWQPGFFGLLFPRQQKIEGIKQVVDLLIAVLGLAPAIAEVIRLLFPPPPTIDRPTLDSSLPPTSPDKILDTYSAQNWKSIPWIDRQVVNTLDLQRHPLLVLVGRMKSGKTREAGELLRQAVADGIVQEAHFYDITGASRELEPESIQAMLEKKLDCASRTLFYLNELPADAAPKRLAALGAYLKALGQCSPGYFVTTVRADHLENNPALKKWLDENHVAQIPVRALTQEEKSRLIDELVKIFKPAWQEAFRQVLIKRSDGTPYHLILIFQRLAQLGHADISLGEVKKMASQSLEGIWNEIRREFKKREPASASLLDALSIFYHARVIPTTALVFELAETLERSSRFWTNPWKAHSKLEQAANALRYYDITYQDRFSFPDVAVESLTTQTEACEILERFLRGGQHGFDPFGLRKKNKDLSIYKEAFFQLAVSYYYQKNIQRAEDGFRWVTIADERFAPAWYNLGVLLGEQGRTDKAEAAYRQAVAADPQHAPAWNNLGGLLKEQGKPDEAEAAYRQAVAADPQHAPAWYNLGVLLGEQGKVDEEEAAYRQSVADDPKHAVAWYSLGSLLVRQGKLDEAETAYHQAVAADPKFAQAWTNMGLLLKVHGKLDEAETAYRQAVAADPKFAPAWYNLGLLLKVQGKLDEAITANHKAVAADPKDAHAWYNLGVLLGEQGKVDEEEAAYRQSVAADPKHAPAWTNLGVLYRSLKRYPEAQEALEKAVLYLPEDATLHSSLGAVYQKLGRREDAQREFTEAQRLSENESCYNLACIDALCGDLERAFSLLAQAVADHEVSTDLVRQDPDWEDLREHPRFKAIVG